MDSIKSQLQDASSALKPWDQQPGEPDKWYGRFQVYLELGPTRTIRGTVRQAGLQSRNQVYTYSPDWAAFSKQWRWRERAQAWDVHRRDMLALSEHNARLALRKRRVNVIEDYLEAVREVLDNTNMADADEKQARAWLPQMRQFLLDLLVAERQEFERIDYERSDPNNNLTITADDLRAAQRELEARANASEIQVTPAPSAACGNRNLVVCIGPDSRLMLDLAVLRTVRAATGLRFTRVLNASRYRFAETLRRERNFGRPVEFVHLALHGSADGIQFADGIADGNWLSERLFGVRVMLLACCEGESVGDWLGVVPHVITLSEEISHEDAAVLTQHFWHGIGMAKEPGAALDEALGHCPPAVSEYVVRHW